MVSGKRTWFDRILCPLDFAAESEEALRYAVALARIHEAKLYVCHCMEPSEFRDPDKHTSALAALHDSIGRHILAGRSKKLDWEPLILKGDPSIEIPRQCAERRVDLVVIRSRRRGGLAGALGSTAEALACSSPCSVLVTGPNEREWAGRTTNDIDPRRILVAYDFSREADDALSLGLSFAQEYQAELYLMYVLRSATISGIGVLDPAESQLGILASQLSDAVPAGASDWCRINQIFAEGDASREILRYAESHPIDLICMGATGDDSLIHKILGSTANRVIRGAACPVLVARTFHAAAIVNRAAANKIEA